MNSGYGVSACQRTVPNKYTPMVSFSDTMILSLTILDRQRMTKLKCVCVGGQQEHKHTPTPRKPRKLTSPHTMPPAAAHNSTSRPTRSRGSRNQSSVSLCMGLKTDQVGGEQWCANREPSQERRAVITAMVHKRASVPYLAVALALEHVPPRIDDTNDVVFRRVLYCLHPVRRQSRVQATGEPTPKQKWKLQPRKKGAGRRDATLPR